MHQQPQASGGNPSHVGGGTTEQPVHLIFLAHGLNGTGHDFVNTAREIRNKAEPSVLIHCATANASNFRTYDGIEPAGRRLAQELLEVAASTPRMSLSLIGHSLGGMYLRQMIYILHNEHADFFANLELRDFVTLATPHLGIRRPQRSPLNFIFQHGAQSFRSGAELSLEERRPAGTPPLLWRMAMEEDYLAPLKCFRRRALYSNVFNDIQVYYSTGALRPFNPYRRKNSEITSSSGLGSLDPTGHATYPSITATSIDHPTAHEIYKTHEALSTGSPPPPASPQDNGQSPPRAAAESAAAESAAAESTVTEKSAAAESTPFQGDSRSRELVDMLESLNTELAWERFDVLYRSPLAAVKAHEWICGKNPRPGGNLDVPRHLASWLFGESGGDGSGGRSSSSSHGDSHGGSDEPAGSG